MRLKGFTLIECIVTLFVTVMVVETIQFSLSLLERVDHVPADDNVAWYLFLRELESSTNQYELIGSGIDMVQLNSPIRIKYYEMRLSNKNHCIYLRSFDSNRGYLPLLNHVKKFSVSRDGDTPRIKLQVEFLSGEQHTNTVSLAKFSH